MQPIKDYITARVKFLQEITDGSDSENLSTAAQIHELKVLMLWINQHEQEENEPCNN